MKRLTVKVTEIKCKDPQDPRYDEIYFVTATNSTSEVSKTLRRISRGTTPTDIVIFDHNVNESSPILITAIEQRLIKDNSKAAKMMERLAQEGLDYAVEWVKDNAGDKVASTTGVINKALLQEIWKQVGEFLLVNLIALVKLIFRDSPLLSKVIVEPYQEDITYPVLYVMKGKSDSRPTYDYEIKLLIDYK